VRRPLLVMLVLVAGVALIVGLYFVFRSDSETASGTIATTAGTGSGPAPEPAAPTLEVTVRDGKPAGGIQQLTVAKGERVRIVVHSDVDDEVHVHGYDVSRDVESGATAELELQATITGRFEIELEESGTPIAELEVR
jgi:FtsP/CotA-like multicopper oxidase with cupredoxin domain